jgi:hypothetical protein
LNSIAQIKTVVSNEAEKPTTAMMISVNIDEPATAEDFVAKVAEQFKLHRTMAPPSTSMLLVTVIGGMTAEQFATCWRRAASDDEVLRGYMSLMRVADVVQGTRKGQQLSKVSLLLPGGGKKPWWKFW